MLPTTRRMSGSGIARPRDLLLITRGSHLEKHHVDMVPLNAEAHPIGSVHRQSLPHTDTSVVARSSSQLSSAPLQIRSFHTSSPAPYDSTLYNVTDVPEFFSKYKERKAASPTDSVSSAVSIFIKLLTII